MSNVVEFVLKLKDLMSGGMQRAAATAQGAAGRVNTALAGIQNRGRQVGSSISDLNRRIEDLKRTRELSLDLRQIRDANREIARLEARRDRLQNLGTGQGGSSAGKSGGGLMGAMGGVKGIVAGAGIAAATAGIGSTLSQAMDAGAQKISLEVMAGKEKGGQLFGDLTKFANDSIFGTEVFQNAQTMKAFGMQTEKVMPTMRMLGDISMGNKEKMGSLTLAYSQIQATGRLMGQDLLQLVNAGFNPLQIISQKTGIGMDVLKEKMEKGGISAKMVEEAFRSATGPGGQFFQMTQKIAETPFGKWEALKGQVSGLAVQFGDKLMPVASKVIDFLGGVADKVPAVLGAIEPVINSVLGAVEPVMAALQSLPIRDYFSQTAAILPQIVTAVKPVVDSLMPLVKTVFGTLGDFAKQQGPRLLRVFQAVSPVLANVGNILSNVLGPALKLASWLLGKLLDVAVWVIEKLSKMLGFFTNILSKISDAFTWVLDKIGDTVKEKVPALGDMIKDGLTADGMLSKFGLAGNENARAYLKGFADIAQKGLEVADMLLPMPGIAHLAGKQAADKYFGVKEKTNPASKTTPTGKPDANTFNDFSGLGKTNDLKSGKEINGGGLRAVNITIHKFFDNNIVNVRSVEEGREATGDKTAEELLRISHSVGETLAN